MKNSEVVLPGFQRTAESAPSRCFKPVILVDSCAIGGSGACTAIEGAVQPLRPKLMTVCAVLASLIPILWASGIGSDVMKPIAAPMVGGMTRSTIHVLILVPVFFVLMKERALRRGTLRPEIGVKRVSNAFNNFNKLTRGLLMNRKQVPLNAAAFVAFSIVLTAAQCKRQQAANQGIRRQRRRFSPVR